jgi:hypothetical protein
MSEEQEVEQTEVQVATEKEARLLGWVPKEEFRDGDHWVDAEAFVKRGKEINPILRKNNETLLKKLEAAQSEIAEVKKVAKEFEKFQKDSAEKRVKELQAELVDLKEKKKNAVSQGDGAAVVAIDDAIDAVKEQQQEATVVPKVEAKPVVHVPATLDPVITGWMEENTWFTTDDKLTRIADAIGVSINQNHPNLTGKAFFDELDKELAEVLPERLKKRVRSSPVEGATQGNNRPTGSKKESYENLPADAKAACDRFIKQGMIKDRAQYVNDYDWT